MSYGKYRIVVCLIALAVLLIGSGSALAVVVLSYPGATTFDGIDDRILLSDVFIGLEGTMSMQFKAHNTVGLYGLWFCANTAASTDPGALGQYRIEINNGVLWFQVWPADCSAGITGHDATFQFTDTTQWHTVSLSWKDGYDTLFELDGVELRKPNLDPHTYQPISLNEFTTTPGNHVLGACRDFRFFDGEIRNVVMSDTYQAPEPSGIVLMTLGFLGMLAHVWRTRA